MALLCKRAVDYQKKHVIPNYLEIDSLGKSEANLTLAINLPSVVCNFGSLGVTFTLRLTITLAPALSLTFRKADAHARVHAHGHVSTQATGQSTAD